MLSRRLFPSLESIRSRSHLIPFRIDDQPLQEFVGPLSEMLAALSARTFQVPPCACEDKLTLYKVFSSGEAFVNSPDIVTEYFEMMER